MTIESIDLLAQDGYNGPPPPLAYKEGKGHVSVNPTYGCGIGCPFCISRADPWWKGNPGAPPWKLASPEQLLDALVRQASFIAPLRLSLFDFSDPFTPSLEPALRTLLTGLADRLTGQAVLLTTRVKPRPGLLDFLEELRSSLRISLFVSLGDATGNVKAVTPVEPRLELLRESARRDVHTVMLLRPLASEWVRDKVLRELLAFAGDTCHEIVLGGLRAPPAVDAALRNAGWPLPAHRSETGSVEPGLRDRIVTMAERLGNPPVSEHRSCAINRFHGMSCLVARRHATISRCLDITGAGQIRSAPPGTSLCDFFDSPGSPARSIRADKCDMESERCRVDMARGSNDDVVARPCELGPPTCDLDVGDAPMHAIVAGPCGIGSDPCALDVRASDDGMAGESSPAVRSVRDRKGYCRLENAA